MQNKFLLILRLYQEKWAGQHVFPHLDSQINSYSSSPHATEVNFSLQMLSVLQENLM